MGRQRRDPVRERSDELRLLRRGGGAEARAREAMPRLLLERNLATLPRPLAQLHRRLEERELVSPRAKAALAAEVAETPQDGNRGVVGGLLSELVQLDRRELRQRTAPPEHLEAGRSEEEPVQTRHRFIAAGALHVQVEMPLLEAGGCCERAHIRISVGSRHGLTF